MTQGSSETVAELKLRPTLLNPQNSTPLTKLSSISFTCPVPLKKKTTSHKRWQKGTKKKVVGPFSKEDQYDVKAPAMFDRGNTENC